MLKRSMSPAAKPSQPPARREPLPVLWTALGFVGGLLPLIVFIVSVGIARHNRPAVPIEPPDSAAVAPDHDAMAAVVANRLRPAADPRGPADAGLSNDRPADRSPLAAVDAPKDKERAATLAPIAEAAPSARTMLANVDMRKVGTAVTASVSDDVDGATAFPIEPDTRIAPEPTQSARSTRPSTMANRRAEPETPSPMRVEDVIRDIVRRHWAQNDANASFPKSDNIRCTTGKKDISCWTDVLTGKHYSGPYHLKIKMILDKIGPDGNFVMTYRELILDASTIPAANEADDLNNLHTAIQPGWAPMIHRLPCQLHRPDRIVCSPVGESAFVLSGKRMQARAGQ